MFNKICVMGLGYIGLPTSSLFATNGIKVIGVDINKHVVDTINSGDIHIEEPGLKTLVSAAVKSGNLVASLEPQEADAFIIAVPTPFKHSDNVIKEADMSYVELAMKMILPYLKKGNLVILESTSPIGTCEKLLKPIIESANFSVGEDIYLAHCPERVLPGKILKEAISNARIIGGINEKSSKLAEKLYRTFVEGEIYLTNATTAEMCKLMENTYRDVNIALANELANICSKIGINAWEVIEYANKHPRVNIHSPGPGVGGHCISVDPWFIIEKFPNEANIIKLCRITNDNQPKNVVNFIKKIDQEIEIKKITIMGITYKGNVDDTRESPAIEVINLLKENFDNISISIYDPHVKDKKFEISNLEDAFKNSDLALLLTNHNDFKYLSPDEIGKIMNKKIIYDTRNCLDLSKWEKAEFRTYLLGRD
ncbi:MAG: UDP-N-acetyl-D-mannosamine dehydrogenase [Candidatus Sericytochromatia bacterium]|nr:MAG: UDP-N-acetyl-D-mannosamine dehydrogenase [Candidatus Sericytochromatia bacterium]